MMQQFTDRLQHLSNMPNGYGLSTASLEKIQGSVDWRDAGNPRADATVVLFSEASTPEGSIAQGRLISGVEIDAVGGLRVALAKALGMPVVRFTLVSRGRKWICLMSTLWLMLCATRRG